MPVYTKVLKELIPNKFQKPGGKCVKTFKLVDQHVQQFGIREVTFKKSTSNLSTCTSFSDTVRGSISIK